MGFERFVKQRKKGRTEVKTALVTITKRGDLVFNKKAIEEYKIEERLAVLFYNRKRKVIGIKFVSKAERGAVSVKKYGKNGKNIFARAFFKFYGVNMSGHYKERRYIPKREGSFIVIDLKEGFLCQK